MTLIFIPLEPRTLSLCFVPCLLRVFFMRLDLILIWPEIDNSPRTFGVILSQSSCLIIQCSRFYHVTAGTSTNRKAVLCYLQCDI